MESGGHVRALLLLAHKLINLLIPWVRWAVNCQRSDCFVVKDHQLDFVMPVFLFNISDLHTVLWKIIQ